jgi:hypothetical protein
MAPNEADGTKCLKMLIRHHGVDVQCRKSIWTLVVGSSSFAFSMQHMVNCHIKKIMSGRIEFSEG